MPQMQSTSAGGLDLWKRCMTDPVLFARTLLPKKPHKGQVKWLRDSNQPINVLVPANRWGKSTVIAMKHIHHCVAKKGLVGLSNEDWFRAEYQTISTAMSFDQAGIVFQEAKRLLNNPVMKPLVKSIRTTPFPAITFFNGSIMHCRSLHDDAKYVDGHAYRFLSVDEAGWISNLRHLINTVLLLRLAGGGNIDLIGTPKGYNDLYWYYDRGARKIEGYYSQRGSIYDNPFLPEEDIKMRDRLLMSSDPRVREQVLFGEFVDYEGLAFTRDQIDNAFRPDLPQTQEYKVGHKYVTAWDLARQTDFTVGVTLDITKRPWVLVDFQRMNKVAWEQQYAVMEATRKKYNCRYVTIDATGPQGDVIEEEMTKRRIPTDAVKINSRNLKLDLVNGLQTALDEGRQMVGEYETMDESGMMHRHPRMEAPREGNWGLLRIPMIVQLMDEIGIYRLDDRDLVQDSVMALALAVAAARDMEYIVPPVIGGLYG